MQYQQCWGKRGRQSKAGTAVAGWAGTPAVAPHFAMMLGMSAKLSSRLFLASFCGMGQSNKRARQMWDVRMR